MQNLKGAKGEYLETLKKRAKETRISRSFQFIGIEIAMVLKDMEHKSLYMKMAKEHNPDQLLSIAKDVAQNKNVNNKGGYFMRIVQELKRKK